MTADTTSSLRDLYVEALRRNWSALPDWDLRAAANTILHVRDSELDQLRNQVADYERQLVKAEADLKRLRETSEKLVAGLTAERDALADELAQRAVQP